MMAENGRVGFSGVDVPSDDVITNCMHCGLCLPVCPTYALTGNERSSPRGRIRLIRSVADGSLAMTDGFIDEMNFCLDCQACETACPAGVKYGSLVEAVRDQIRHQKKQGRLEALLKWIFLRKVLSNTSLLKITARFLWFYQHSGMEKLLTGTGLLALVSPRLAKLQKLSPRADKVYFDERYPEVVSPTGPKRYTVGFLSGCLMNVAFAEVNADTVQVLLHHGCEVLIPPGQGCCGSLQAHNGDFAVAKELARKNIDAFLAQDVDAIVMNSAGCGAMMKEYGHYLHDDPVYAENARRVSSKVKDISEFLFEIGLKRPEREFPYRVSYHDACHLVHSQKVSRQPRELIRSIPGLIYTELPEASWCCGSAGIYNVVRYDDAMKILDRKIRNIDTAEADFLVANNPGCLTQIQYGLQTHALKTRVVHLSTLLAMVYGLRPQTAV